MERLRSRDPELPVEADLIDARTDLLGLIDRFPSYGRVVLVDAVLDPEGKLGKAGAIVVQEEAALQSWPEDSPSLHQISPLLAIRLFRRLCPGAATRIHLVGLCTDAVAMPSPAGSGRRALSDAAVTAGAAAVLGLLTAQNDPPY